MRRAANSWLGRVDRFNRLFNFIGTGTLCRSGEALHTGRKLSAPRLR